MHDFYKSKRKIIANPNCSTIQCVVVLNELSKILTFDTIIYNTYQAISGAGKKAIDDYLNDTTNHFPLNIKKTCIHNALSSETILKEDDKLYLISFSHSGYGYGGGGRGGSGDRGCLWIW